MTDFPTLLYTSTCKIPTLLNTRSLKKVPLSGGASPYRPLWGVPPSPGPWTRLGTIICWNAWKLYWLILVTGLLSWFNPDQSPWTPLLFFVFSYVWSGFIVLLGISLNVYSKNEAKINAWIIKHGAKYSTYLFNRRQKRTTLMENVWSPIFIMASPGVCLAIRIIMNKSQTQRLSRTDFNLMSRWSGELA